MFAPSRIRGPYGTHVTAELALKTGRALANTHDQVVLGHDPKDNARLLADAVAMGVRECGSTVHRLGAVTSPTVSNALRRLDADVGIVATSAADPTDDTGFKLFDSDGSRLSWERQRRLVRNVNGPAVELASWDDVGDSLRWDLATAYYIEWLCEGRSSVSDTHVVVDVGGHDTDTVAVALERLGCEVHRLTETDDTFPRQRVSTGDDVCTSLCRTVATSEADFGVAHDADADRLVAVDETGTVIGGDTLLALFARNAVEDADGDAQVAVPLESSRRIEEVVERAGGSTVRTEMDHASGTTSVATTSVVFGGEPSGVHHWPDESPCPDAALSAIHLAHIVDDGPRLSTQVQAVEAYPLYFDSYPVENTAREMSRITSEARERFDEVQTEDGVFVELDGAWFVVRPSRTEHALRVTVEGTSNRSAKRLFERVHELVTKERATVAP
ncbi:phosphoglucosamine mutase [Haloferax sp. DFSO52]|uniref:phosphoglucosamine mutase n=1 Tax=Haloferax sp. DFSO52 TaxID=3388505 RepID=UPI003A8C8502